MIQRWHTNGKRMIRFVSALLMGIVAACASPTASVGPNEYRVQAGDTLTRIARQHGQAVSTLMRLNNLPDPNKLERGQLLIVRSAGTPAAARAERAASRRASSSARATATELPTPTTASIALIWPAPGQVVGSFGSKGAKGIDIANSAGTAVTAAANGTVAYANNTLRNYGNLIIVRHSGNYMTIYAHNRRILVKQGQTVRQGEKISEMGPQPDGRVALYFEVRAGGTPVNPTRLLPAR
jgi:murein DD-endopeptidase MepM/ murein hydrolase activator NlpD